MRAVCNTCGYDLAGLRGPTCPECGSELARADSTNPFQRLLGDSDSAHQYDSAVFFALMAICVALGLALVWQFILAIAVSAGAAAALTFAAAVSCRKHSFRATTVALELTGPVGFCMLLVGARRGWSVVAVLGALLLASFLSRWLRGVGQDCGRLGWPRLRLAHLGCSIGLALLTALGGAAFLIADNFPSGSVSLRLATWATTVFEISVAALVPVGLATLVCSRAWLWHFADWIRMEQRLPHAGGSA